jgi:hypothetical protein
MASTPTADLASERLGQPVTSWITDQRSAGASWQRVVIALHQATGLEVSVVTLRNWMRETSAA